MHLTLADKLSQVDFDFSCHIRDTIGNYITLDCLKAKQSDLGELALVRAIF